MKKFLALALALCMTLALGVPAFAATTVGASGGTGTVPVTVNAEASRFSVTVPTSLPISLDENGAPTTLPAAITNNGTGPVKITNLEIAHVGEWATVDFDTTNLAADKIGTKHVAVKCGEADGEGAYKDAAKVEKTTGADAISFNAANWSVINGGASMNVKYDAYIPLQAEALNNVTVANLIFTISWDTAAV